MKIIRNNREFTSLQICKGKHPPYGSIDVIRHYNDRYDQK